MFRSARVPILLAAVFAPALLLALLWPSGPAGLALASQAKAQKAAKPAGEPHIVFKDPNYDFELRRSLGYTFTGGADINECLKTARKIKEGDDDSWYRHWHALAELVQGWGQGSLAKGHRASAREAFLRACNYHRMAEFYLHGNPKDPRIVQSWRASRENFRRAAKLMDHPVEVVKVPYEDTTLPGYFLKPDKSMQPRKTLILQTGFDGIGEELYFSVGKFALARGYNVLICEGPGQGGVLREQKLYFRTDWEKVVTPMVDYLLKRGDVDPKRIAIMGRSMGGYLVPRAAAFEHRLAVAIANPGAYDMYGDDFPSAKAFKEMNQYSKDANADIRRSMKKDPGFRWWINNGMFTCGKKTPLEFMNFWRGFTLKGVVKKIKCPTLVIVSEQDVFFSAKRQKVLYEKLTCPKTMMIFSKDGLAPEHCQMGATAISNQRILDWLDQTLKGMGK